MDKFNQAIDKANNTISKMQWDIDGMKRQAKHDRVLVLVLLAAVVTLVVFSVTL